MLISSAKMTLLGLTSISPVVSLHKVLARQYEITTRQGCVCTSYQMSHQLLQARLYSRTAFSPLLLTATDAAQHRATHKGICVAIIDTSLASGLIYTAS